MASFYRQALIAKKSFFGVLKCCRRFVIEKELEVVKTCNYWQLNDDYNFGFLWDRFAELQNLENIWTAARFVFGFGQ